MGTAQYYLLTGCRLGLEPGPRGLEPGPCFDGGFLYPYFRSIGLDGPPVLSYIRLRASGPCPSTRAQAEEQASHIRRSGLFDAAGYTARAGSIGNLDPVLHYLIIGERKGIVPNENFDPAFYAEMYPEITTNNMSHFVHYILCGKAEGRQPLSLASKLTFDLPEMDRNRDTVLLVVHQATRTGAPILAYNIAERLRELYNLVLLLLDGGELTEDFGAICNHTIGPIGRKNWLPPEINRIIGRILNTYPISYVIANTIDTRVTFMPLTLALVPVVTLVHEFPCYLQPKGEMGRALEWATEIVFSANVVLDAVKAEYPALENRPLHVLPQGPCELPPRPAAERAQCELFLRQTIRPDGARSHAVILGCGTVTERKGVDIFFSCAAALAALKTRRSFRFVWIGRGADTDADKRYASAVHRQLTRDNLEGSVVMLDEVPDLEAAYASADLFLLSSRLDPLPNVCIDAVLRGIPIICFEGASGIADLLSSDPKLRKGVIPAFDVQAAAAMIALLIDDPNARAELGALTRSLGAATFDMDQYVRIVDELGCHACETMEQRKQDLETISGDELFDLSFFKGYEGCDHNLRNRRDAISFYLARSAARGLDKCGTSNFHYRRPAPGFHPQIYVHEHQTAFDPTIVNPLAHFIRSGKPVGLWRHDVITPGGFSAGANADAGLRTALHGHFYYPELIADCIARLKSNRGQCDLLLSTDARDKAKALHYATRDYDRGKVLVRIVPNRGRDIGAFLTGFQDIILGHYDIICHVHSKRSNHAVQFLGESWREFLWQHLLGDIHPMMDIIIQSLAKDPNIGIVFPEDPHLSDWDSNLDTAQNLAQRLGFREPLPRFFDFPLGTMFWARTRALQPLFDLNLLWVDYPTEPVPIDGTILHAIERLLPFVARHAGFTYVTTHVPGVIW